MAKHVDSPTEGESETNDMNREENIMTNSYSLSPMAQHLLMLAATGEGETSGFIDTYRRRAGNTPVEVPEEPGYPSPALGRATKELVDRGLAVQLRPRHLRDRKGAQLTQQGHQLAEQIAQTQLPENRTGAP